MNVEERVTLTGHWSLHVTRDSRYHTHSRDQLYCETREYTIFERFRGLSTVTEKFYTPAPGPRCCAEVRQDSRFKDAGVAGMVGGAHATRQSSYGTILTTHGTPRPLSAKSEPKEQISLTSGRRAPHTRRPSPRRWQGCR